MNGFYDFRSYRRTIQEIVLIRSISLTYIAFFFVLKYNVIMMTLIMSRFLPGCQKYIGNCKKAMIHWSK